MILSIHHDMLFYNYHMTMSGRGRINVFLYGVGSLSGEVTI